MDGVVKTEDTKRTPLTLVDYMMLKHPDAYEAWLSDNTFASGEQWPTTIRWKAGIPDLCGERGDASGNRNTEALAEHDPLETMIDNAVREAVANVNEWKIALDAADAISFPEPEPSHAHVPSEAEQAEQEPFTGCEHECHYIDHLAQAIRHMGRLIAQRGYEQSLVHHGPYLATGLYRLVKVNDDDGKQEL